MDSSLTEEIVERITGIQIFEKAIADDCLSDESKLEYVYSNIDVGTVDHSYCIDVHDKPMIEHCEELKNIYVEYEELMEACDNAESLDEVVEEIVEDTVLQDNPTAMNTVTQAGDTEILLQHGMYETIVEELEEGDDCTTAEEFQYIDVQEQAIEPVSQTIEDDSEAEAKQAKAVKQLAAKKNLRTHLCYICGKFVFHIPDHLLSHTKDPQFACDRCPFATTRKSNLKLHVENVHLKKVVRRSYKEPSLENDVDKAEYLEIDDSVSVCSMNEGGSSANECDLEIGDVPKEELKAVLVPEVGDDSAREGEEEEVPFKDGMIEQKDHGSEKSAKTSQKQLCPICGKMVYDVSDHKLSHSNERKLCLSGNDANLLPTSKIIDATLTIDDVERFTGICIEDENISCVICEDCHNKLLKFTAFRVCCMTNDVRFRKMVRTMREHGCEDVITTEEAIVHSTNDRSEVKHERFKNVVDGNFTVTYVESTFDDHAVEVVGEKSVENSDIDEEVVEIIVQTDLQTNRNELDISVSPASVADQQHDEPTVIDCCTNDKRSKVPERSIPNATYRITSKSREAKLNKKYTRKQQLSRPTIQKQLCPMCGKLVQYLPDHIVSHTKEQKYACEHCSMTCSRKSYLKLHVEAVHLKKVVKSCELCNRDFTHISGYTAHMRAQHNVGEWYVCKICNLKFRHPGGLRGHNNRKHNAESNCECPICGMKFEDKKGLKDHSRVHSNEKPFACTFCPKRFKSPNAHRTHMLVHRGVVFACTLCPKSYRYKSLLNAHMKKVHTKENLRNDPN
ncbi:oocyte zinc finger protein XlCOF6-like [Anopheles marshallii]|uniref:oocyte zinc finger protein XlCOF6-like n=1 Tax=Anopheles marshallii TaxID=1521116 RepID=UPI00237BD253|nr:oocyte zinc finger protein XlCOF6-like [Anopheles marshallii]